LAEPPAAVVDLLLDVLLDVPADVPVGAALGLAGVLDALDVPVVVDVPDALDVPDVLTSEAVPDRDCFVRSAPLFAPLTSLSEPAVVLP
jgi:hypothetical protein